MHSVSRLLGSGASAPAGAWGGSPSEVRGRAPRRKIWAFWAQKRPIWLRRFDLSCCSPSIIWTQRHGMAWVLGFSVHQQRAAGREHTRSASPSRYGLRARFTTGILKMRMRATWDFGTFSAPLHAPEAEAQTPKAHAQSAVRVRREARVAVYGRRTPKGNPYIPQTKRYSQHARRAVSSALHRLTACCGAITRRQRGARAHVRTRRDA